MEPQQPLSPKLPEQEAEPTIVLPKPVAPVVPQEPAPPTWFTEPATPRQPPAPDIPLPPAPPHRKSHRGIIIFMLVLIVIVAGTASLLTFTKKPSKPTTVTVKKTTVQKQTTDQPKTTTPKTQGTPLTQTINTELGYVVQLNDLVLNYPAKYPDKNVETVLVKSTISENGAQYSGASPTTTSLYLVADDVEYSNSLIVSRRELDEAGYTSMPIGPTTKTTPLVGYKAFDIPVGSKKLVFRVKQDTLKVTGTSTVITGKQYDVAIP